MGHRHIKRKGRLKMKKMLIISLLLIAAFVVLIQTDGIANNDAVYCDEVCETQYKTCISECQMSGPCIAHCNRDRYRCLAKCN